MPANIAAVATALKTTLYGIAPQMPPQTRLASMNFWNG